MNQVVRTVMTMMVGITVIAASGTAEAKGWPFGEILGSDGCPIRYNFRTPQQVMADHIAALEAGDLQRAMCDYAQDAVVIMPGSVIRGRAAITEGFSQFYQLFGGRVPTITSMTIEGEVAFDTFTLETEFASIPDGADTFVIRFGRIRYQTVHSTIVFHQPPPSP